MLIRIYIPLCIYFNRELTISMTVENKFTFHYVSISTGSHWCGCWYECVIYIPLCIYFNLLLIIERNSVYKNLHSTMYLFQPYAIDKPRGRYRIYIPLCIYFNRSVTTFVYGCSHIYIPLCIYFNLSLVGITVAHLLFTFHYVSISTHLAYKNQDNL